MVVPCKLSLFPVSVQQSFCRTGSLSVALHSQSTEPSGFSLRTCDLQEFTRQTDAHHRSLFNADSLNLWISFYCDFYGAVMLVAVGMFAVSQRDRGAANVGLAFSNTIQLLVFYTWTLRLVTEAISLSSAVEQVTWLAHHTPIDGKDDINNAGKQLESALFTYLVVFHVMICSTVPCTHFRIHLVIMAGSAVLGTNCEDFHRGTTCSAVKKNTLIPHIIVLCCMGACVTDPSHCQIASSSPSVGETHVSVPSVQPLCHGSLSRQSWSTLKRPRSTTPCSAGLLMVP